MCTFFIFIDYEVFGQFVFDCSAHEFLCIVNTYGQNCFFRDKVVALYKVNH